ncbi:MAG: hypothetical protein Tsb0019_41220 [Roseibium sp.]
MADTGPRTPSREFDRQQLLDRLAVARHALVDAQRGMRPRSGLARTAAAVISEIDEFAFVLTGASDYFHARAHGTPPRLSGPDN